MIQEPSSFLLLLNLDFEHVFCLKVGFQSSHPSRDAPGKMPSGEFADVEVRDDEGRSSCALTGDVLFC